MNLHTNNHAIDKALARLTRAIRSCQSTADRPRARKSARARSLSAQAEVEYERGPVEYQEGGMYSETASPGPRMRRHFKYPSLTDGIWCPLWAQIIVDNSFPGATRVTLLRWATALPEETRVNVVQTVLALSDEDALAAIDASREQEEV